MDGFRLWQRWLLVVSLVILAFGLLLAFFTEATTFDWLFNDRINPVFWNTADVPAGAAAFQQWVYGVVGATVAGWGIFMAFIAQVPFSKRETLSWNCLALGLAVWFVTDKLISPLFRAHFDAIFNAVVFTAVALPLAFSRKHLHQ